MLRIVLAALAAAALTVPAIAEPLAIGAKVDSAALQDLAGSAVTVPLTGQTTVVMFIATKCPISNDYNERMSAIFRDYAAKGVKFVFVNSNFNEPAPEVGEHAKSNQFPFPVHKDPDNKLADRFGATVTPEAFVFDKGGVLRYHGYLDDSRNAARVQVQGLSDALNEVIAGKPVSRAETKAFGCTIKRVKKAT